MRSDLERAIFASVGFALLWSLLAGISPTTTYHLAPAIVAGVGPVLAPRHGWLAPLATLGVSLGFIVALDLAGWLAGESLLPVGGPALESILAAVGGAVVAWLAMRMTGDMGHSLGRTRNASED